MPALKRTRIRPLFRFALIWNISAEEHAVFARGGYKGMRFQFEGREYGIVFAYDWRPSDDTPHKEGHRQMTRSMIFGLPHSKGDDPVIQGTVYRHYKDLNSKEAARKAALKKCLENAPLLVTDRLFMSSPDAQKQLKELRRIIWQAYQNRKGAKNNAEVLGAQSQGAPPAVALPEPLSSLTERA